MESQTHTRQQHRAGTLHHTSVQMREPEFCKQPADPSSASFQHQNKSLLHTLKLKTSMQTDTYASAELCSFQ